MRNSSGSSSQNQKKTSSQTVKRKTYTTETVLTRRRKVEVTGVDENDEEEYDENALLGLDDGSSPSPNQHDRSARASNKPSVIYRALRFLIEKAGVICLVIISITIFAIFIKANWNDVENVEGSPLKNSHLNRLPVGIGWTKGGEELKESMKGLKRKYPAQTSHTWVQIYSAILSTMSEAVPRQPSALVLLAHPALKGDFSVCLSREIGVNVNSIFYNITGRQHTRKILEVNEDYLSRRGTVTDIHNDLKTYLNNGKVVIIQDVDRVNREDHLMIIHAFCDNSAAPDKRATFIFTVSVPQNLITNRNNPGALDRLDWKEENAAEISQKIFHSSWTSLSPDKRPALIARVAANVVLIHNSRNSPTNSDL